MTEQRKQIVRQLIEKYFEKHNVSYANKEANFVDDDFDSVEEAIREICEEYKQIDL